MKHNNEKYIKAILSHLKIADWDTHAKRDKVVKALSWAVGCEYSVDKYEPVALRPVLETVKNGTPKSYFRPQPLSIEKKFFPLDTEPSKEDLIKHFNDLKEAVKSAKSNFLLNTIEYYGSSLAASSFLYDISLYDLIKIASAICHCLESGNGKLRILGGNVSGIQAYLYDIVSKRASKLLKGRSFYIQLIADTLCDAFLEEFSLSPCHVVYSSGGGFYIIIPSENETQKKFEDIRKALTQKVYEVHGIHLSVDFEVTEEFEQDDDISQIWGQLFRKINANKLKRLSSNPEILKNLFLKFVEEGGLSNENRDAITNEEIPKEARYEFLGEETDKIKVSALTKAQIDKIGKNLKEAKYWITSKEKINSKNAFEDLLGYWHLLSDRVPNDLPAISNVRILNQPRPDSSFFLYGGNNTPEFNDTNINLVDREEDKVKPGDPLTYDIMARGEGLDLLGVLRMDVDDLGSIFISEIGTYKSLSRYATLSRSLDWFFKGYLNTVHQQKNKEYKDKTLIVYSGGDDLFVVGRWDLVLEMALEIQADFSEWTGNNLTISAGLVSLPPKFPIMQAANMAGREEKKAKEYEYKCNLTEKEIRKNSISLFGKPLNWQREMPIVKELRDVFFRLLDTYEANESILQKIQMHGSACAEQEKKNLRKKWTWNLIYDLSRFENALRSKNKKAADIIANLRDEAFKDEPYRSKQSNYRYIILMQMAARCVELKRRTLGKSRKEKNN